ncbi:HAD family hydrolase [Streptomyces sclerotialus]|uniref:HAD family hydrolase n=1 Tax=Streptomyces sclerotialus TaxID=1957 RepID=UPI0004C5210A
MEHSRSVIAFFDVDETLISVKSMLGFLAFHWEREGADPSRFAGARARFAARQARGVPRDELNRDYYRLLRGVPHATLVRTGREWFSREAARTGFFHPPAVAALDRHRRAGHLIALVSGAVRPCLEPLADAVGASLVLSAALEVEDGVLTGEVDTPVIGPEKAVRARDAMRTYGSLPGDCYAYGDHSSDLPLLQAVGHPVVVGDDPVLAGQERRLGWRRLPGVIAPRSG